MSTPNSTRTKSVERTWDQVVAEADPDRAAAIKKELEYTFSNGREFKADPRKRGPYAED